MASGKLRECEAISLFTVSHVIQSILIVTDTDWGSDRTNCPLERCVDIDISSNGKANVLLLELRFSGSMILKVELLRWSN